MRRIFLAGAMTGVIGLTAVSAAWGCSPNGLVLLVGAQWSQPGGTVTVRGSGFEPDIGAVELRWDSTGGPPLGAATAESFTVDVTVPVDAAARVHYVTVVQRRATGGIAFHSTVPLEIRPAAGSSSTVPPSGATQPPVLNSGPVPADTPAGPTPAPVTPPGAPAKPAPSAARSPAPAGPAAPARSPAVASAPAVAAPADPGAPPLPAVTTPATPATPVSGLAGPDDPAALPAPSDLWSGLGTDPTPNLLDAVTPRPGGGGLPVGGLLFGGGVLAMAAVGLVAGRRRFALSRSALR